MCGICGIVSLGSAREPVDPVTLDAMCATLVHRGPDSAGQIRLPGMGMAMRRLAIIDVNHGDQPLLSEDDQVVVICNGEIYNFRDLREQLRDAGHVFRTDSDCEVIVHGYEAYGDAILDVLDGMFAVAIWDNRRQRMLLARDRTGIKPLYYAECRGQLLFGSEAKAILAHPSFERALDLQALNEYLTFEYVPTPRSIYRGMRKLRPGHALIIENGKAREIQYWRPDLTAVKTDASEPELAAQLWHTLRSAVSREMVSDVPLGVFLSGGIDSSAVAAAMAEVSPGLVRSFSIGFSDPSFDESAHARAVAQFLGTEHNEMVVDAGMLWELTPTVAGFLDEPLADPSILPTFALSRFARQQVTVALGGDGGDELFAGYSTLQAHRLAGHYLRLPHALRQGVLEPLVQKLPVSHNNMSLDYRAKRFVAQASRPIEERHQLWMGAYSPDQKSQLLVADVRQQLDGNDTFGVLEEHMACSREYDQLSSVLYLDMKMYMEGDILPKVDRASMACSLEVRVPLLNTSMLEFVTHLPIDLKLHRLTRKYLLRKAVAGKLPQHIIDRPKKGFGIPVAKWFRGDLRPLLLDTLSEARLRRQGLFNPAYVSQLIDDHQNMRRDNRKPLWSLLMFQLWHERWLEGGASV